MKTYINNIGAGILLFACCVTNALAQENFTPKSAGPEINSAYPELNPIISEDGNELFFVRANHPSNTYGEHDSEDIWYSKRGADGKWSEAIHVPELNIGRYNAVWTLMPDGKTAMIHGHYNKNATIWKKRGFSMVHRSEDGKWGKPVAIKIAGFSRMNRGLYTTAYLAPGGTHLLMSFSKRYNGEKSNLYVSERKKNGRFSKPEKIKIRQHGVKQAPFVSADGKKLFFTSNVAGNYEVLVAERLDDTWTKWSVPVPASKVISTSKDGELYFRTNSAGSFAWYTSIAVGGNPDLNYLKLFEENPFIVVSGKVINKNTNQPVTDLADFQLLVNDTLASELVIGKDGAYSVKLPLGKNYQLTPQLNYHHPALHKVEAATLIDYTETSADLYVTPWSVVEVSGNMLQRSSKRALPAELQTQVLVNGSRPDSIAVDAQKGKYTLWLPFGANYTLQLQAPGYTPEVVSLKLDTVAAYRQLAQDLFADKVQTATVQGKLLDRKTGTAFPAGIPVQVVLNDTLQLLVADSLGTYEVKLPLGKLHSLSAKAEGYYPLTELVDLQQETASIKIYKDLYLAPVEVGQSIRLNNVFFETAKATLKQASFPELDRVVALLEENPGMKVEIAGHTDNKGSASLNNKLSANRADAVEKYIVSKGIAADRLSSKGYGSTKPEADNTTEEGRSQNRRVEFTILKIVE